MKIPAFHTPAAVALVDSLGCWSASADGLAADGLAGAAAALLSCNFALSEAEGCRGKLLGQIAGKLVVSSFLASLFEAARFFSHGFGVGFLVGWDGSAPGLGVSSMSLMPGGVLPSFIIAITSWNDAE